MQCKRRLTIIAGGPALHGLQVMLFAQHPTVVQRELLARAQLPLAGVAREARQVVHPVPGPPHPVRRADGSTTLCTASPEIPAGEKDKGR